MSITPSFYTILFMTKIALIVYIKCQRVLWQNIWQQLRPCVMWLMRDCIVNFLEIWSLTPIGVQLRLVHIISNIERNNTKVISWTRFNILPLAQRLRLLITKLKITTGLMTWVLLVQRPCRRVGLCLVTNPLLPVQRSIMGSQKFCPTCIAC